MTQGFAPRLSAMLSSHRQIWNLALPCGRVLLDHLVQSHGQPSPEIVKTFLEAGYRESDLNYIVLAIAVKTVSNFSNHLFATPVDERFAAYKVT